MDKYAMLTALKQAMRGEKLFRPSSIERTLNCHGWLQLAARSQKSRRTSKYALEGSAAHKVAEMALRGEQQPDELVDRRVFLWKDDKEGHLVDEEMMTAVNDHLDVVYEMAPEGTQMLIEQYMSLAALDTTDPILAENAGTGDTVVLHHIQRLIDIIDLKYGKGVMVSAEAPQLKNYAILAIFNYKNDLGLSWLKVRLTISQPRAVNESERVKTVEYDVADLMNGFLGDLLQAMDMALTENPPLTPGKWCHWCPCKDAGTCTALQTQAFDVARDVFQPDTTAFSALDDIPPVPTEIYLGTPEAPKPPAVIEGQVILPPASSLAPGDIANILNKAHLFETFLTSVRQRAALLIQAGTTVPGWMVSQRIGHRKFVGEQAEVEGQLREIGVKMIDMYTAPKMKSPRQIEMKLPAAKRHLIEAMITRPLGEPTLMPTKVDRIPIGTGFTDLPVES